MIFRIEADSLKLAIVGRPRGGEWLQDDILDLRADGIDILVSLLTPEESVELGLEREEAACATAGIDFRNFPIPDTQTPKSVHKFLEFARALYAEALAGRSIGAHCKGCIGRSTVLLATIMRLDGFTTEDALDRISAARGMSVPDNPVQAAWVAHLQI